jgi:polysaccharide biosynthesis transport protein
MTVSSSQPRSNRDTATSAAAPRAKPHSPLLLTEHASNSNVAESFRMLRTSLLLAHDRDGSSSVLVTSAGRDEGKSLTCANLGIVLGQTDRRVAIVDADLRLATMHRLFGTAPGTYPELLQSPGAWRGDAAAHWIAKLGIPVHGNLVLFPAGCPVAQPSELLASEQFGEFLDALVAAFDFVLIDSPPVDLVTDAVVLATQVDGVLFVVDYESRNRRQAQHAIRTLRGVDAEIMGTVLNQFPQSDRAAYGTSYGAPIPYRT